MVYKLSNKSKERLATCDIRLQKVIEKAITESEIDFGVTCGHRTIAEQQKLYAQGRTTKGSIVTQLDGVKKKGKHNYTPSLAVDVVAFIDGKVSWEGKYYHTISKAILKAAKDLGIKIRWGGDWDGDGITSDEKFIDLPHFELV